MKFRIKFYRSDQKCWVRRKTSKCTLKIELACTTPWSQGLMIRTVSLVCWCHPEWVWKSCHQGWQLRTMRQKWPITLLSDYYYEIIRKLMTNYNYQDRISKVWGNILICLLSWKNKEQIMANPPIDSFLLN